MEITLFLLRNFGLKHVTLVTDLRCFKKPGPVLYARHCGFNYRHSSVVMYMF